jgi:hypothetical protein
MRRLGPPTWNARAAGTATKSANHTVLRFACAAIAANPASAASSQTAGRARIAAAQSGTATTRKSTSSGARSDSGAHIWSALEATSPVKTSW